MLVEKISYKLTEDDDVSDALVKLLPEEDEIDNSLRYVFFPFEFAFLHPFRVLDNFISLKVSVFPSFLTNPSQNIIHLIFDRIMLINC